MPSYRPQRSRKPRKESRTIPVKGKGDDDGKYYKCWHCGFICDVDRDELGSGPNNIAYQIYDAQFSSDNSNTTDGDSRQIGDAIHGESGRVALLSMLSVRSGHVIMEQDAAGDNKPIRINWEPDISTGCPFCGSKNWRGDY